MFFARALNFYTRKCNIKNYQKITKKQISCWCLAFLGSRPLSQTDPSQGQFLTVFAMFYAHRALFKKEPFFCLRGGQTHVPIYGFKGLRLTAGRRPQGGYVGPMFASLAPISALCWPMLAVCGPRLTCFFTTALFLSIGTHSAHDLRTRAASCASVDTGRTRRRFTRIRRAARSFPQFLIGT